MTVAGGAATGYDVFLSHKSEYKPWVEWLGRSLQGCGFSVFLDKWNLIAGESWVEGLNRGVEQSRAAVLVATPDVVNSGWVKQEYNSLMRRHIKEPGFRLVPIMFGDAPHLPFLSDVQCVDARDPARYREWFHRLLCGLRGLEPGQGPATAELLQLTPPPVIEPAAARPLAASKIDFLQRVMARVQAPGSPPVMVTVRGRRHLGAFIHHLQLRVRETFGADALLHLTPPCSSPDDTDACFAELGRQAELNLTTADAAGFGAALSTCMKQSVHFVLITGFENAHAQVQQQLASTLRSVMERHVGTARVLLLGSEKLIRLKYEQGNLSLLSHADVQEWPDPDLTDVRLRQQQDFPLLTLSDEHARQLLDASGGHAGLIRHGLETWATEGGEPAWADWCYSAPELWDTWYALKRQSPDLLLLRSNLERTRFGPQLPWSPDDITRRLYWADLLKAHNRTLVWRNELVRQVGAEVLA